MNSLCVLLATAMLLMVSVSFATPVPDTGQTKCYNATVEIPCPSPDQPFYGQDANYTINSMSFTKLDGSGNALPDSATSWVMVRDNVTSLIWEMKTNKDGVKNYNDFHDSDNLYTWYDSNPATNGGDAGASGNGTDTEDFIKSLNDAHYGGYSDWRLPTIKELAYIVNHNIPSSGPLLDTGYFPNTQKADYWSSTSIVYSSVYASAAAAVVSFGTGEDSYDFKWNGSWYARAVRGGQSQPAYVNNGNGTVTDTSTGLMWQQTTPGVMAWEQALSYCQNLTLADYRDWRLPTQKELRSLVDYSRIEPAINTTYFPDMITAYYLSSTTSRYGTAYPLCVDFHTGRNNHCNGIYKGGFVRAVRGGQAISFPNIKANEQVGQITVSSGTPVSITASLAPGNENGKLSDWWIAESTPWGLYTLTSSGWLPEINMLFQYPLFSVSPVEIYKGSLPFGDYTFYFGVDMNPNGILDLPLYYDYVQVHVAN